MENNKNKKSVKFQGDMSNFCDFIQVFVFTRNHQLKVKLTFDCTVTKLFSLSLKLCVHAVAFTGSQFRYFVPECRNAVSQLSLLVFCLLLADDFLRNTGDGRMVRCCWVNFQCRGVLLILKRVGQGPTAPKQPTNYPNLHVY